VLNEACLQDVQAWIRGPVGTPYAGGHFRIRLTLGPNYPAAPPKAVMLTKIFHPNISASGEICVNVLKRDWTRDLGTGHVLLVGWP
jgi:ubiquitin-conjugating enzyme E2 S